MLNDPEKLKAIWIDAVALKTIEEIIGNIYDYVSAGDDNYRFATLAEISGVLKLAEAMITEEGAKDE